MADLGPAPPVPAGAGVRRLRWYALLVPQVASLAAAALFAGLAKRAEGGGFLYSYDGLSLTLDVGNLALLGLSAWFLARVTDPALPARLRPLPARTWAWVLAAGLVLVGLSAGYEALAGALLHIDLATAENAMPLMVRRADQWLPGLLTVVLLGPLTEEVYFRGVLMGWLARHWGTAWAVGGSALVFGLAHLEFLTPGGTAGIVLSVELILMGAVLALTALRTGSLWASFAIHAVNNLCALLFQFHGGR